uniref:Galectin n=1 Tax=Gongylonema pulchrum TaxID=637853 RepID=A0A183E698_9BILA
LPLHLSIRFDEGKMVYNTYIGGNWSDSEQRIKNPFKANAEFDLRVRIINNKYQVFANRAEVGTFDQRMPLDGVRKRFNINLYRANRQYALQVSVRFNEGAVVRNAMQNNVWGREEREGGLPISKGEIADVTIINERFSFQVFFNGNRFATFAHRGSPDDIETVEIDGDCEIYSVTVNNAVGV